LAGEERVMGGLNSASRRSLSHPYGDLAGAGRALFRPPITLSSPAMAAKAVVLARDRPDRSKRFTR